MAGQPDPGVGPVVPRGDPNQGEEEEPAEHDRGTERGKPKGVPEPALAGPPEEQAEQPALPALQTGDGGLQVPRQVRRVAEAPEGLGEGQLLIAAACPFLLEDAGQMGEELLTHPALPRGAGVDRPHGALDVDHEFFHAGAPRMPPMTLTKCRHSSRPSASRRVPFFVRW